jgi:hypothetical protein
MGTMNKVLRLLRSSVMAAGRRQEDSGGRQKFHSLAPAQTLRLASASQGEATGGNGKTAVPHCPPVVVEGFGPSFRHKTRVGGALRPGCGASVANLVGATGPLVKASGPASKVSVIFGGFPFRKAAGSGWLT